MKRNRGIGTLATTALLVWLPFSASALAAGGRKKAPHDFRLIHFAEQSITGPEAAFHVEFLASDDMRGRGTGTPGQWLAAKYIASEFARYGLSPIGEEHTYYQRFQIYRRKLGRTLFVLEEEDEKTIFAYRTDYQLFEFSGANRVRAEVVFAGYGITAPEYGYDDYAGVDVRGKVVLVLRHEPRENDPKSVFKGTELTEHAYFEAKALNARRHGAVGLLLVTDPVGGHADLSPQGPGVLINHSRSTEKWQVRPDNGLEEFPALWVDGRVAHALLRGTGVSLLALQQSIDRRLVPRSFALPKRRVHVSVLLHEDRLRTENVVGLLRGSDPRLRDEVVVIGAHYDHLGERHARIYHGADDNASGTAGLLEIAEAFSEASNPPPRSLLFIAFSAEELGLLGSEYYVDHPLVPLANTVTMINLDMIGRNDPDAVSVIGSNRSPELHALNIASNRDIGLVLKYNGEKYFNRSDHAPFARHRIPVLFYNTEAHADYHRPGDVFEKVNPEKIARISRLAFLVAWTLSHSDQRPSFRRP